MAQFSVNAQRFDPYKNFKFALLKPAEFVVIKIQQIAGQIET